MFVYSSPDIAVSEFFLSGALLQGSPDSISNLENPVGLGFWDL